METNWSSSDTQANTSLHSPAHLSSVSRSLSPTPLCFSFSPSCFLLSHSSVSFTPPPLHRRSFTQMTLGENGRSHTNTACSLLQAHRCDSIFHRETGELCDAGQLGRWTTKLTRMVVCGTGGGHNVLDSYPFLLKRKARPSHLRRLHTRVGLTKLTFDPPPKKG